MNLIQWFYYILITLVAITVCIGKVRAEEISTHLSVSVTVYRPDQPIKKELKYQVIDKKDNSGYKIVEYYY